jgi:hypothetical protein
MGRWSASSPAGARSTRCRCRPKSSSRSGRGRGRARGRSRRRHHRARVLRRCSAAGDQICRTSADLNVLRLLNEPTAAARLWPRRSPEGTFAVYDLGAAFDISILRLVHGVFQVLSTGGLSSRRDDFDRAIAEHLIAGWAGRRPPIWVRALRHLLDRRGGLRSPCPRAPRRDPGAGLAELDVCLDGATRPRRARG